MTYFKNKNRRDRADVVNQQPEHIRLGISPVVIDTSLPQESYDYEDFYCDNSSAKDSFLNEEASSNNIDGSDLVNTDNDQPVDYFLFLNDVCLISGNLNEVEKYLFANLNELNIDELSLFKKMPIKIGLVVG